MEKSFLLKVLSRIPAVFGHLYTLLVVLFSWLLFHFEDLGEGFSWLSKMFGFGADLVSGEALSFAPRNLPMLLILAVGSTPLPKKLYEKMIEKGPAFRLLAAFGAMALLLLSVASLVSSGFNPFIYFNF